MNTLWQCAVCETINQGGRTCSACGAAMTRRSAAVTSARGRLAPVPPPSTPAPLPEPIQRAINREPLDEADDVDWDHYRSSINVVPLPGGCLFSIRPRRRDL
jgi:hypothetical protein